MTKRPIYLETILEAYDLMYPSSIDQNIYMVREDGVWFARDAIDDQNFGGGTTPAEALLELIAVKGLGRERINDH